MTVWSLLEEDGPRRGAWNMAVDEALLEAAEAGRLKGPVLRLYAWSPPCLSIGYHQSPGEACDLEYCRRAGIDVVRRPTGGRAVLHDDEATYAVVALSDGGPFAGLGLVETYGLIAGALAASLRILGLPVAVEQRAMPLPPGGGAPCFLIPSQKELLVGGRKVVGSAQRRGTHAFLQHGSVPLTIDYGALGRATGRPGAEVEAYARAFAGLSEARPGLTRADLAAALRRGFGEVFSGPWEPLVLGRSERETALRLEAAKSLEFGPGSTGEVPAARDGPEGNEVG
jgi:lipoate-protein ligase A